MPSSTLDCLTEALELIIDENPLSVLDLGVGFGKWGYLCREYLECYRNQVYTRKDWKCRIDGVETFLPYIGAHQRSVYRKIYIRDLDNPEKSCKWLSATHYDLYLAMDVLEHLHHWKEVLNSIPKGSGIIAAVPNGESVQGVVFDNPHEQHVVTLYAPDLEPYFDEVRLVKRKLLCIRHISQRWGA